METKQLLESAWLKAEDTTDGTKVVVVSEGEFKENEGKTGKYTQLVLDVELDGKRKKLGLNRGSHESLSARWGTESKNYVGKVIVLKHVLTGKFENGKPQVRLFVMPEN